MFRCLIFPALHTFITRAGQDGSHHRLLSGLLAQGEGQRRYPVRQTQEAERRADPGTDPGSTGVRAVYPAAASRLLQQVGGQETADCCLLGINCMD